jgi:predicted ATPase/class 3 adenylate cyclase
VRFLRSAQPAETELAAWRDAIERLRSRQFGHIETLLTTEPVGVSEAMVLEDDGAVPVAALLAKGPLSIERALVLAHRTCEALANWHAIGSTHGSVSAHSAWVTPGDGRVVFAAVAADQGCWAPELFARADRSDARSDLYGVGAFLHTMLTGDTLFQSDDPVELAHLHAARKPPDLRARRPETPPAVASIVSRLLAKAREDRYQTAHGLLADLGAVLAAWRDGRSTDDLVLGVADRAAVFALPNRLYGREHELETLQLVFDRSRWGRCEPVLLAGAPGIGKSALAAALRTTVQRESGWFIAGKFDQYQRNVPYSALVQAFTGLTQQVLSGSNAQLTEWRQRIATDVGANARVLVDLVPELELLTGPLAPAPVLGPIETRNRFNATFRDFVRLFSRAEQPLVLMLDDLQWADGASLSLVATLALDATVEHVVLLGAYRDNELESAPLLTAAMEEVRTAGIRITTITVGPISQADTTAIIADTLHTDPERCKALGALVHGKTGGNPFFIRQFLRALHDERLLTFDSAASAWVWDLARVRARDYSENVAELMATRLKRLSPDAIAALRVAACVGATFSPPIIAAVIDQSEERVVVGLDSAVTEGLVEVDTRAKRGDEGVARYHFVHDRVQQAAYALISVQERPLLRRRIGEVMRRMLSPAELDEVLFDVVTNLIAGIPDNLHIAERLDLAALCLTAGQRARASLAYEDARIFLRAGLEVLADLPEGRENGFALRSALFECSYLTSRFAEADALFERLLKDAPDATARAHVCNTKILIDTSQGRSEAAVRLGIDTARDIGVRIPAHPNLLSVLVSLASVQLTLRGRATDALRDLPPMTDPRRTAAIGVLLRIGPAAYFNNPEAFLISALGIVRLSLRYGHASGSSFGYVIYAMVLGSKLGNARRGQEFGKLAVALSDRFDAPEIRVKIRFIFAGFVNYWVEPYQTTLRMLADTFPMAMEAGDLQYAGYCHNNAQFLCYAFGLPLSDVVAQGNRFRPFITQANDAFTVDTQALMRQRGQALQGRTVAGDSLTDDGFNEGRWIDAIRAGGNLTTLTYYLVIKLQLAVLFRDTDTALRMGEEAIANHDAVLSQIQSAELHLYYGLALAAVVRDRSRATGKHRRTLASCRKTCARHARDCAANYEPWHLLLEAEVASGDAVLTLYDKAIESARRYQQPNIEAFAAELAARSQLAVGRRTVAQAYLRQALSAYEQWQAAAKVTQLVKEFGELLPERALAQVATPQRARRQSVSLSIEKAMVAARELADETAIDRLLERLLTIAIEGAGAESGRVILARDDELFVEAAADAGSDAVQRIDSTPVATATGLCAAIVQTVARRRTAVVLADAGNDEQFGTNPDVRARNVRSVACLPILWRERLIGLLYVENNLTGDAFTPERTRLLLLMASEVGVAVERVRLAHVARESSEALGVAVGRVAVLEKAKAHLGKFVPPSVQRLIDANPDAPALEKRELDVTILFLDIEGYTRLTEALPRERLDWLVRTYFSRFLDLVHHHRGEINETAGDGLMILFQDDDSATHAANACHAAMDIRKAAEELNASLAGQFAPVRVNIGINSGAALVGSTRLQGTGDARWTFTATGSVTNIAARLGAFATGGMIVISESTAMRVGDTFPLESLGTHALKNVSAPVALFQVT